MNIKTYTINTLLNKENLIKILDIFWDNNIQNLNSDETIVIIVRLVKGHINYNTLSVIQLNANNKLNFYNEIKDKAKNYYGSFIDRIEISYNIKTGLHKDTFLIKNSVNTHSHFHYKLPITMNPLEYGDLINTYDNIYVSQLFNNVLFITINDDTNHIELYKKGIKIMEWIDKKISEDKFIRYIGVSEYLFDNNILITN